MEVFWLLYTCAILSVYHFDALYEKLVFSSGFLCRHLSAFQLAKLNLPGA
jgi:hypothetical protein